MLQYVGYLLCMIIGLIIYSVPFVDSTDPNFDSKFNVQQDVAVILMAVSSVILGLYLLWTFRDVFSGIPRLK